MRLRRTVGGGLKEIGDGLPVHLQKVGGRRVHPLAEQAQLAEPIIRPSLVAAYDVLVPTRHILVGEQFRVSCVSWHFLPSLGRI